MAEAIASELVDRLATKGDLEAAITALKGDMAAANTGLKGDLEAAVARLEGSIRLLQWMIGSPLRSWSRLPGGYSDRLGGPLP